MLAVEYEPVKDMESGGTAMEQAMAAGQKLAQFAHGRAIKEGSVRLVVRDQETSALDRGALTGSRAISVSEDEPDLTGPSWSARVMEAVSVPDAHSLDRMKSRQSQLSINVSSRANPSDRTSPSELARAQRGWGGGAVQARRSSPVV